MLIWLARDFFFFLNHQTNTTTSLNSSISNRDMIRDFFFPAASVGLPTTCWRATASVHMAALEADEKKRKIQQPHKRGGVCSSSARTAGLQRLAATEHITQTHPENPVQTVICDKLAILSWWSAPNPRRPKTDTHAERWFIFSLQVQQNVTAAGHRRWRTHRNFTSQKVTGRPLSHLLLYIYFWIFSEPLSDQVQRKKEKKKTLALKAKDKEIQRAHHRLY